MTDQQLRQTLSQAMQLHQAGRLEQAEPLYRQVVTADSSHADALHLLGVLLHQRGQHEEAVAFIGRAIARKRLVPEMHSNLGEALRAMGRLDEAARCYRKALQLRPNMPVAMKNLGNVLRDVGPIEEAIQCCRTAVQWMPQDPECRVNLGLALQKAGQLEEAIAHLGAAVQMDARRREFWTSLGGALAKAARFEDAARCWGAAIQAHPQWFDAHLGLARALYSLSRLDESAAAFGRAAEIEPERGLALAEMAAVQCAMGQFEAAIATAQEALARESDCPEAHNSLGLGLMRMGHLQQAIDAFTEVIALRPLDLPGYANLGVALQSMGRTDEAVEAFTRAVERGMGKLTAGGEAVGDLRVSHAGVGASTVAGIHSNLLLTMLYQEGGTQEAIFAEHRRFAQLHAARLAPMVHPRGTEGKPRLRIGYVSPDLRTHSVAYFLEGLLANHDGQQFEVVCYSDVRRADETTERLRGHAHQWRDIVALTDSEAAKCIAEDGVDVLVDLAGHTADNRMLMFARKPAPVQISYLGYQHTSGLDVMDWRMTDGFVDPPGVSDRFYTEKLLRLPRIFACYRPPDTAPPVAELPALAGGPFTFGWFGRLDKLTKAMLRVWGRILAQRPGARLLLVARGIQEPAIQQRLMEALRDAGGQEQQVEMRPEQAFEQYLVMHGEVDLALDVFPFNGHTTTCHGLWMGVPIVTLCGESYASRMGAGVQRWLGLEELAVRDEQQYVVRAVEWSSDLSRLAEVRRTLRERMRSSALMDGAGFAREVEAAYRHAWRAWCAG